MGRARQRGEHRRNLLGRARGRGIGFVSAIHVLNLAAAAPIIPVSRPSFPQGSPGVCALSICTNLQIAVATRTRAWFPPIQTVHARAALAEPSIQASAPPTYPACPPQEGHQALAPLPTPRAPHRRAIIIRRSPTAAWRRPRQRLHTATRADDRGAVVNCGNWFHCSARHEQAARFRFRSRSHVHVALALWKTEDQLCSPGAWRRAINKRTPTTAIAKPLARPGYHTRVSSGYMTPGTPTARRPDTSSRYAVSNAAPWRSLLPLCAGLVNPGTHRNKTWKTSE